MKTPFGPPMVLIGLVLAFPVYGQDYEYQIDNGTITIERYTGPGGEVIMPDSIGGLPVRTGDYVIPDGVASIGTGEYDGHWGCYGWLAFDGCAGLTGVTIPTSVVSIGARAFAECSNLSHITIPAGVKSIGTGAFRGCTGLSSVYFEGNAPNNYDSVFADTWAVVYYLPDSTAWGRYFGGRPTAVWQPRIQDSAVTGGDFGFAITWAGERTVVIDACTDLANPTWSPMGTITLTEGTATFIDPDWATHPAGFYRVRGESGAFNRIKLHVLQH